MQFGIASGVDSLTDSWSKIMWYHQHLSVAIVYCRTNCDDWWAIKVDGKFELILCYFLTFKTLEAPTLMCIHCSLHVYFLVTVLIFLPMVPVDRIHLTIKTSNLWWTFPIFSWPQCLMKYWCFGQFVLVFCWHRHFYLSTPYCRIFMCWPRAHLALRCARTGY